jgi:hypothetical protein
MARKLIIGPRFWLCNKRTRNIHKGTGILRSSRLPVVMSKKQGEKEFPTENGHYRTGAMKGGAKWSVWLEKYQRGII